MSHNGLLYQGGNQQLTVIDEKDHRVVAKFMCEGNVRAISLSTDKRFINFYSTHQDKSYIYKVNLDVTNVEQIKDFNGTTFMRKLSDTSEEFFKAKVNGQIIKSRLNPQE